MISEFSSAIAGLRGAIDLAKAMLSLKNEAERNAAVIEIQRVLLDAQQALQGASMQIESLQRQLQAVDQWVAERQRYQLNEISAGSFVLTLKPELANSEPAHSICPKCAEDEKKSVLQKRRLFHDGVKLSCNRCGAEYVEKPSGPAPARNSVVGWMGR